MVEPGGKLEIEIDAGADSDEEELAELTRRLRDELVQLDVLSVDLARSSGEIPEGAKAIEAAALGALVVNLASSSGVLAAIGTGIRRWLQRQRAGTVKLTIDGDTIELDRAPSAEQERLVELWIARHACD
jgi:hypothetical protein